MRGDPAAWDWGVGGWGVLVASCDDDVDDEEEEETLPPPLYIMAGLNRLPNEDSTSKAPLPTIKFAAWLEFEDDDDEDEDDEGAEASLDEETIAADEDDDDDEDDEEEEEEEEEVDDGVGADVPDAAAGADTNSSLFCWPAATTNEAWFGGITFPK